MEDEIILTGSPEIDVLSVFLYIILTIIIFVAAWWTIGLVTIVVVRAVFEKEKGTTKKDYITMWMFGPITTVIMIGYGIYIGFKKIHDPLIQRWIDDDNENGKDEE